MPLYCAIVFHIIEIADESPSGRDQRNAQSEGFIQHVQHAKWRQPAEARSFDCFKCDKQWSHIIQQEWQDCCCDRLAEVSCSHLLPSALA